VAVDGERIELTDRGRIAALVDANGSTGSMALLKAC